MKQRILPSKTLVVAAILVTDSIDSALRSAVIAFNVGFDDVFLLCDNKIASRISALKLEKKFTIILLEDREVDATDTKADILFRGVIDYSKSKQNHFLTYCWFPQKINPEMTVSKLRKSLKYWRDTRDSEISRSVSCSHRVMVPVSETTKPHPKVDHRLVGLDTSGGYQQEYIMMYGGKQDLPTRKGFNINTNIYFNYSGICYFTHEAARDFVNYGSEKSNLEIFQDLYLIRFIEMKLRVELLPMFDYYVEEFDNERS